MSPRWSLAKRLTRWFALIIGLLALAVSSISAWFLHESVGRQLDALVQEELDEMQARFPGTDRSAEDFAELVREFGREHEANPLAWRVWGPDGAPWGDFGSRRLLEAMPGSPGELEATLQPRSGLRYRAERVEPGLVVGLMVDGSWQVALLRKFLLLVGVVAFVSAGVAIGIGGLFGRRLAGHLRAVAESARSVQSSAADAALHVDGAPDEIREVADALTEMLQNIRRESDRARLMTSGLAHELRSPIQNLLGEAEVALLRPRGADEYRAALESQLDELRDLARVVDNLVSLCAAAEHPASLERFDLGREADLRLGRERARAERRGVTIALRRSGELAVEGDREALLLAVHNVVGNAVKWSPPDGRVDVAFDGDGSRVLVTVDDAGPGIPDEDRERIFEPFYRGRAADRGRVGYGLGLALTRTAVQAHGGSVEVERSPAGGARLRLTIPYRGRSSGHVAEPRLTL